MGFCAAGPGAALVGLAYPRLVCFRAVGASLAGSTSSEIVAFLPEASLVLGTDVPEFEFAADGMAFGEAVFLENGVELVGGGWCSVGIFWKV